MNIRDLLRVLLAASLLVGSASISLGVAGASPGSRLSIVESNEQGIVLELVVHQFQLRAVPLQGETSHRLIIPGLAQTARPGEPQTPVHGTWLGLPSTSGVSVQILATTVETMRGYRLAPAPVPHAVADPPDHLLTGSMPPASALKAGRLTPGALSPHMPVKIGDTGYIRDQAVALVQFYPVRDNPLRGEVYVYRRIRARVTWEAPLPVATTKAQQATSPAYEHLLSRLLLNYTALKRPAAAGQDSLPSTTGAESDESGDAPPALKIGVTEDGLYALTYDDLAGAGFDLTGVDPRTITISHRGVEIPIYVQGEEDGTFDPTDFILFYGTAIADIYTTKNVYWLTTGGTAGRRMNIRDGTLMGSAPVPTHFPTTLHAEHDTYYWQTMPEGAGQDHWFWDDKLTAPASRNHVITVQNISTGASAAAVRVRLKGRTDDQSANPDHHTKLSLNGVEIDNRMWDGQITYDHAVVVPHTYLRSGDNTLTVESVGDTGAAVDQVFVDWIDVDYWDTYVAENDELRFGAPAAGTFQFEVTGFSSSSVTVVDVSDPMNVALLANATVTADGSTYTLKFEDAAQPETRYLALTSARYQAPASLELDEPSSWKSPNNAADYIIITHEDFYDSAQRLADARSAMGLRVATVKVEDLYDEFNYGIFNPQAIRDLLTYAYANWVAPAPTYVVLLGDAYQDYQDHLQTGTLNYVPSQIIETDLLGETPSDNWFVLVSGQDILPDLLIGRLPAQTVAEAEAMVDKILQYEQFPPDASWNTQVLLVSDDDEEVFETISEELAGLLPQDYTVNRVYAGHYPPGDPTTDIAHAINSGSALVNYTGHGSVDMWGLWNGSEHIFDRADITALANISKLPVVTVANCLNGFFTGPKTQVSVAEEFMRLPDRGAVAIWAPTGLSYPDGERLLMEAFYKAIFESGEDSLGIATTAAKLATYAQDSFWGELVEMYILFGDPATRLGLPPTPVPQLTLLSPHGGEAIASGSVLTIHWAAPPEMVRFTLRYSLTNGLLWREIAQDVEGTQFDWLVPIPRRTRMKNLIQVIGFDASGQHLGEDQSDAPFTIGAESTRGAGSTSQSTGD